MEVYAYPKTYRHYKMYIGFSNNVFFPMDSCGFQQECIDFIKMCSLR